MPPTRKVMMAAARYGGTLLLLQVLPVSGVSSGTELQPAPQRLEIDAAASGRHVRHGNIPSLLEEHLAGGESAGSLPGASSVRQKYTPVTSALRPRGDEQAVTAAMIFCPAILGLLWSAKEALCLRAIDVKPKDNSGQKISNLAGFISAGANSFLWQEFQYLIVFAAVVAAIIGATISPATLCAFAVGAVTSGACALIGMRTAVYCNIRTTLAAWREGLPEAFSVAVRGGSIMGLCLVSLGVINMYVLMLIFDHWESVNTWESIPGYGLGGSSIALFARVGGGIYTKAADVGADLSGKNEYGMEEDDPRNPACIADNVGDNVGDVAGMGADLFGSLAESTCAAFVISGAVTLSSSLVHSWASMCLPLMISSTGIVVGITSLQAVLMCVPVKQGPDIERALKSMLFLSTLLETPVVLLLCYFCLPETFAISNVHQQRAWWMVGIPVTAGLWSGLLIGLVTEYYTSHSYRPVREISESQIVSASTGIIYGLALGYMSCAVPVLCLGCTIVVAYYLSGMYGVAMAALGMLSTLTVGLTIDGFGPISDNAGGLAEMAELPSEVRNITDALDAAGNTTAAIGKGFAVGSATLVSLALFGAFCEAAKVKHVDLLETWCILGLLLGSMLPFLFSALTMRSVGHAANEMVKECFDQFPKILKGEAEPDYDRCISISTQASLREMIAPGCLVVVSPIAAGCCFGKTCTAGLLCGALATGTMLAISMNNSGGAWDNSKKYIKAGGLGEEHKKNETHKNSVTGDTVGDPMKDTSGPSLNILIKLSAIVSLIFAPVIIRFSQNDGGPKWMLRSTWM
mmetsp:Transcript_34082/g.61407  ORF Transcript_34082/g.61407 Transcript_34082/m.61407 type:complete len:804 (+) Transcript_34082:42-2453(+)